MMTTTSPYIAAWRVQEHERDGVRPRRPKPRLRGDLTAGLRSLVGGEIQFEYTQLLEDTRRQALDRIDPETRP